MAEKMKKSEDLAMRSIEPKTELAIEKGFRKKEVTGIAPTFTGETARFKAEIVTPPNGPAIVKLNLNEHIGAIAKLSVMNPDLDVTGVHGEAKYKEAIKEFLSVDKTANADILKFLEENPSCVVFVPPKTREAKV